MRKAIRMFGKKLMFNSIPLGQEILHKCQQNDVIYPLSICYIETEYYKAREKIGEVGFSVFSQNDEDGVIQWLFSKIETPVKKFIEFGVQDYQQSNTRYLHIKDGWGGLLIDGDEKFVNYINHDYRLKNNLNTVHSFITVENINEIILQNGFYKNEEIGILSIDIDGNDYWVWQAIDCINPQVVICEYNTCFGYDKAVTIPYKEDFVIDKRFVNSYFGASAKALVNLAKTWKGGYTLIYLNGVNAIFVRNDLIATFVEFEIDNKQKLPYTWTKEHLMRKKMCKLVDVGSGNNLITVKEFLESTGG
ncbi:MAG: hypothetical protein LBC73_06105 [Oscillospiraceae bacterium]|jgi:hypothetical protein|nr:hypothetical protein [Oscillospiraceae bacterium]